MHLCTACKAPLDSSCICDDCAGNHSQRAYCHVCLEMNRVMFRSPYFQQLMRDDNERRKGMGL